MRLQERYIILTIFIVQAICAFFFVSDILGSVIGLRANPIAWQTRELIEILAAVGLLLGLGLGGIALHRSLRHRQRAEDKLRRASSAFVDVLEERFATWSLTPAERDVALFLIKGLSISDIASVRATSEGTVKAQMGAVYRKAGVSGAAQLLSLFIDDLMDGVTVETLRDDEAA